MADELRVGHGPVDPDIADDLTDEEKEWLRSWNRGAEIPGEDEAEDEAEPDPEASYEEWTAKQLRAELEARGLPTSGVKAELAARLEEDDLTEE